MRKREINQKAVSRGGEIKALKDQISEKEKVISEKNKEISALKKRMHESLFAKIRRALINKKKEYPMILLFVIF